MMAPEGPTNDTEVTTIEIEPTPISELEESGETSSAIGTEPIQLHPLWLRTIPGQLICLEVGLSLIAFVSIIFGYHQGSYWFFSLVALLSFLWATFLFLLHIFQLYRRFANIPWMLIEIIVTLIFLFLWFIADMILLSLLDRANTGAALMCGLFAFLAYCGSVYLGVMGYLEQVRKQGTPIPSATKAANKAEGRDDGDDSDSEDSLSEMPSVYPTST